MAIARTHGTVRERERERAALLVKKTGGLFVVSKINMEKRIKDI